MSSFIINGGKSLQGKITVGGSKNAALPIIFATVITRGVSTLYGVPDISDVRVALSLVEDFGARIRRVGDVLEINTENLEYCTPSATRVAKIRASSYLLGACLSRFGRADILPFGGCNFEHRPIDMHISAIRAVGAVVDNCQISAKKLHGSDITFEKISVGATVNAILLCVSAKGKSRIFGYACEPHIYALIDFLRTAGARITVLPEYIEIEGRELVGGTARIIPDMIEAGTYLAMSLATRSRLEIGGINRADLDSVFDCLVSGGACLFFGEDSVIADGELDEFVTFSTAPYPAFPTDLQPQMAPLLAVYRGGKITEGVWHSRFGYLDELSRFGVEYERSGSTAVIKPSRLRSACVTTPDLRGGAALLIAALTADGESIINSSEIINRGYENIVNKLRTIGANIEEIS